MTERIVESVKKAYGAIAREGLNSQHEGIAKIARAFGYSHEDLSSIPAEANMGLSCGNPVAMASLQEGEVVVDLGSGGGLDVFLAAKKVGPGGQAIGIDMTQDMVDLARENMHKGDYQNVSFHLAQIENMPLQDNSIDCVISNCVLNLTQDKDAAFAEIFRILKPGGRLAVSDIALKQDLPEAVADSVAAWTGCIAGALLIEENRIKLKNAGFAHIQIVDAGSDLNAYREGGNAACCAPTGAQQASSKAGCCGSPEQMNGAETKTQVQFHDEMKKITEAFDLNAYAASVKIFALKPA